MLDLLQIKSLRPGVDGMNPKAPNAANYDEAKANPYPKLPDPLVLKNGQPVTTAEMWWQQRRPEIVEDFDREIYGRVPANTPKVTWEVKQTTREKVGEIPVITRQLVGHVDGQLRAYPLINVDIEMTLTTPADAAGPVPVMMEFGFAFGRGPTTQAGSASEHTPDGRRPDLAGAGPLQGLGLCDPLPLHDPGRQRRGPHQRHHRPVQQGPAAQTRRLGLPCAWAWGVAEHWTTWKPIRQ